MRNIEPSVLRRLAGFVSAAGLVTLMPACAPTDIALQPPLLSLESVTSPAGEGSAEPFLSASSDGVVLSWLEDLGGRQYALRMSELGTEGWSEVHTVTTRNDFFVNWADFPSVVQVAPGVLAAHWLQRGGTGTYDYGVRVAQSMNGGRTWTEPWTPHEDGTPTEHGFVSLFPLDKAGWGLVWLDGRTFHAPDGSEPLNEMTLRFRGVLSDGTPTEETLLDGRICDCCQTSAASTSRGPVVVYRDRTDEEIRDIYVTRRVDGEWTEGVPLHDDGWHIAACPVNGPSAVARGENVAVAWFTGANDVPRVNVAFSSDAGATFTAPVQVDEGNPAGRVDLVLLADGTAVVSWLERVEGDAEVRVRRVQPDGKSGPSASVARSSGARASGFPQVIESKDGSLVFAWTDLSDGGSRVLLARAEVPRR